MGGWGSGRRWLTKTTVEECLTLDINRLVKDGLLYADIDTSGTLTWRNTRTGKEVAQCAFGVNTIDPSSSWIRVSYSLEERGAIISYKIGLQTTRPNFGGVRWWFTCPLSKNGVPCKRRVAHLHIPPGDEYFGCRHCYDLTYTSCRESHRFDRLFNSIGKDLGVDPKIIIRAWKKRR